MPDDDFTRGFHGIPDDAKLRAMSYVQLCALLAELQSGSVAYMVVESEKHRRDRQDVSGNKAADPAYHPSDDKQMPLAKSLQWHEKPLGKLWLTVVGGALTALFVYIIKTHLGLAF